MREVEADWDKQTYIDWVNKGRRREGKEKRGVVNKQVQTHHDVTHWFGDYLFWSLEIGFKGVTILVFWSQKLCSWRTGRNWAGARGGSYWEPDIARTWQPDCTWLLGSLASSSFFLLTTLLMSNWEILSPVKVMTTKVDPSLNSS